VSVELDPEDEVQTRALMQEKGLVTVGWCAALEGMKKVWKEGRMKCGGRSE